MEITWIYSVSVRHLKITEYVLQIDFHETTIVRLLYIYLNKHTKKKIRQR